MRRAEHRRAMRCACRGEASGRSLDSAPVRRLTRGRADYYALRAGSTIGGEVYERELLTRLPARCRPRARPAARSRGGSLRPGGASRCCAIGSGCTGSSRRLCSRPTCCGFSAGTGSISCAETRSATSSRRSLLGRALARSRVPMVLHHHHLYPRWARLEAAIARRADAVVTVSEHSRRELVAAGRSRPSGCTSCARGSPRRGRRQAGRRPGRAPGCDCSTSTGSRPQRPGLAIDTLAVLRLSGIEPRWWWPVRARRRSWQHARPACPCGSRGASARRVAALRQRRRAALRLDARGVRPRSCRGAVPRRAGGGGRHGHRRGARRRPDGGACTARCRGVRPQRFATWRGDAGGDGRRRRASSRLGSTGTRARRRWPTSTAGSCGEGAVLDRLGPSREAAPDVATDVRGLCRAAWIRAGHLHRGPSAARDIADELAPDRFLGLVGHSDASPQHRRDAAPARRRARRRSALERDALILTHGGRTLRWPTHSATTCRMRSDRCLRPAAAPRTRGYSRSAPVRSSAVVAVAGRDPVPPA